ncbi:MAG: phosphohydrolase [Burkholderiales bacterium RIFCSPLOWO2_02_FULL_57_36]|nr:MAG: phosphohydrolase [Burkholderiales bacterium RIFCSPLOWO2_02_FULL_57_36]
MRQLDEILASLLVMGWMVEARDPYTGGHLWRVSRYSRLLATAAGLDQEHVARIALGGFLHDLGKIGVPDAILRKPGPLSADEQAVIRTHPDIGFRLLAAHPLAYLVRNAVLSHHERPDGAGYPNGLRGDMVPLDARIVGICDAFDAMTSSRPYRPGMPIADALQAIEDNLGRQFDAGLGRQFVIMGRDGMLNHVAGHSDDGIPLRHCPMCGPTLVIRRDQIPGSTLYCRNCGGEFVAEPDANDVLQAAPTGREGSARDLEPEADIPLIAQIVQESSAAVHTAPRQAEVV